MMLFASGCCGIAQVAPQNITASGETISFYAEQVAISKCSLCSDIFWMQIKILYEFKLDPVFFGIFTSILLSFLFQRKNIPRLKDLSTGVYRQVAIVKCESGNLFKISRTCMFKW